MIKYTDHNSPAAAGQKCRDGILHPCYDQVLLVLNEFHSHKKTECWILKFNSKVTRECPQVPG